MHKHYIIIALFGSLISTGLVFANKPNIIFFMADDMGMGDTSAYQDLTGNSDAQQVDTPNMNRLANMGMRFSDAHTPSSRCTTTRYSLLTGRYVWRSRLKGWVLFGSQGDPLIERDRPTIATLLKEKGYRTGMFGKWHVGLRYRNNKGNPAAGWADADLTQPIFDGPLDHGFDVAKFTSRSHATSGPDAGSQHRNKAKRNGPNQTIGPGHIDGRICISATGNGKELKSEGPEAYILTQLGSRHSDHAMAFMKETQKPFFLYYPANSNHGPYTPDRTIGGKPVAGAARTVSGKPMNMRYDYIYENDVALGRMLDYLEATDDPRNPGKKLIKNTIIIFTSDNGAEKPDKVCTGPVRSNKGSVYEGGHRVPFIVAWPEGGVPAGKTSNNPISLVDMYATFADVVGATLPDYRQGEKGAEDSSSILATWMTTDTIPRNLLFFNDHKEAKSDKAVMAVRHASSGIKGDLPRGNWKLFYDASLIREGLARPTELYELNSDPREENNLIANEDTKRLIKTLSEGEVSVHRNLGAMRLGNTSVEDPVTIDFTKATPKKWARPAKNLTMTLHFKKGERILGDDVFRINDRGLGIAGNTFDQVNAGEAIELRFDRDVIVANAAIVAGNGTCGGFYTMGDNAPLAIYCVDADNDTDDQHGRLSDLGVLLKGEVLRLDSAPHYGVEPPGQWRLRTLTVYPLK